MDNLGYETFAENLPNDSAASPPHAKISHLTSTDIIIKPSPRRYVIMLLFFTASALNNFTYAFSFISDSFSNFYGVDLVLIGLMLNCVLIGYVIAVLPAILIFERKGLRLGVLIGSFTTAAGSWLLCASVDPGRFWLVSLAQIVVGFGQPFNIIVPTYLSSIWFPADQVSRACSIAASSSAFGTTVGGIILPLLINGNDNGALQRQFYGLQITYSVISTVVFLITIFAFKDHPKHAPSLAREERIRNPVQINLLSSLRILFTNRNFVVHLISGGLTIGYVNTVVSLLNPMFTSVYDSEANKFWIIGLLITVFGMVFFIITGAILDKLQKYKQIASGILLYTVAVLVIFTTTFHLGINTIYFTTILISSTFGYIPAGLELNAEITYPIPEVIATSVFATVGYSFSIAFTFMGEWILENHGVLETNIMFLTIVVTALILSVSVQPDYRRQKANLQDSSEASSNKFPIPLEPVAVWPGL